MRTPEQFAVEHAEYMAKAAERFISAVDYLGEQVHNECSDEALDQAAESAAEARGTLREMVYEFRKRAAKVGAGSTAPEGHNRY